MVTPDGVGGSDAARAAPSDFERIGGEAKVRAIVDDFVGRVLGDFMIGYMFKHASASRLRELEYRFSAEHLGADVRYTGRTMREAHRRIAISSGHFGRRTKLLEETLVEHGVPDDIRARWIAHVEGQRDEVIAGPDDCGP
ncbi:MAG: group 1 truncated hemoglobin [Myxococcota bacterium]